MTAHLWISPLVLRPWPDKIVLLSQDVPKDLAVLQMNMHQEELCEQNHDLPSSVKDPAVIYVQMSDALQQGGFAAGRVNICSGGN
jgi:hypothetical protein